jgi:hypothetical protein
MTDHDGEQRPAEPHHHPEHVPHQPAGAPVVSADEPVARPKRNRGVIILGVAAGALTVALVVMVGLIVFGQLGGAPAATPSLPSSSTPVADPTDTPTTEPSNPPVAGGPVIPATCPELFPAGYIEDLTKDGFLALNPAWTNDTIDTDFIGSNDAALKEFLTSSSGRLNCALVKASGGGDIGVLTNVATVAADRQAAVLARMNEAGFTCTEEHGGTTCSIEQSGDGAEVGERHFLRDGTWVATRWANIALTGWTDTIVKSLFPS